MQRACQNAEPTLYAMHKFQDMKPFTCRIASFHSFRQKIALDPQSQSLPNLQNPFHIQCRSVLP